MTTQMFPSRDIHPDNEWKYVKSCWIAFRHRGAYGSTIYWGPFDTYADVMEWASKLDFAVGIVELASPNSDPSTWWNS